MNQTTRIFLAGLLGGLAMMVWTTIAHMLLPTATAGIDNLPNQGPVRAAMAQSIGAKPGFYMFPGYDLAEKDMNKAMAKYDADAKAGPSGLMIYRPAGDLMNMGSSFLAEAAKEIVTATIAAFLLAEASALLGFGARVGFIAAIGAIAALETNVSYRAWYGFPGVYTAAQIFMSFVGYLVAGLVIAGLVKPRAVPPVT